LLHCQGNEIRLDEPHRLEIDAADQTDEVVDPDGVALGTAALREIGWIAGLGIAALRAGAVHVAPRAAHESH
jgi:hypothetical protein